MGLCPKPHQGGSPTLDPPPADAVRHGSPAACRSCLDDAIHRFRAGWNLPGGETDGGVLFCVYSPRATALRQALNREPENHVMPP